MRIGLTPIGGASWPGGRHYLLNLISSLTLLPKETAEPIIFLGPGVSKTEIDELTAGGRVRAEVETHWEAGARTRFTTALRSVVLGWDRSAEASFLRAGVDVVFQHNEYYGRHFALPCIAWIPDFQHRRMPWMFSYVNRVRRDLGYRALTRTAAVILLSSEAARADCESVYPESRGKTTVAHFAVRIGRGALSQDIADCRARYELPERYLYLPNQFWKHKNHIAVVEAMRILSARGSSVVLVLSGAQSDVRHPGYAQQVLDRIRTSDLVAGIRVLGLVPYEDVITLMRGSQALVNPSLSEGWSTTVEEAKLLSVPLVLSSLDVHREQAGDAALYFDPSSPEEIANALEIAYADRAGGVSLRTGAEVLRVMKERQLEFAHKFVDIALSAMSS